MKVQDGFLGSEKEQEADSNPSPGTSFHQFTDAYMRYVAYGLEARTSSDNPGSEAQKRSAVWGGAPLFRSPAREGANESNKAGERSVGVELVIEALRQSRRIAEHGGIQPERTRARPDCQEQVVE